MGKNNSICSFFAGIGGFDLAFEEEGFKTVFQCEINEFCTSVLSQHWEGVPRERDIRLIDPKSIPKSEIWCGGFPCQDVSVARGSRGRDGLRGKNSGLFYPFLELIRHQLPTVILLENVAGLLSSHNGQDFRVILEQLTDLGYAVCWRIMNSRYFGAPQSRPRVFICASRHDPSLAIKALYETAPGAKPGSRREGFLTVDECVRSGARVPRVAYCLAATSGRHTGTDWSRTYISYEGDVRRLTPKECEGIQGFPQDWTRIHNGVGSNTFDLDTPRYQALGNAVAVPLVRWIAKRLHEALAVSAQPDPHNSVDNIICDFEDFSHPSVRKMLLSELHYSTQANGHQLRWQNGGFALNDECVDIKAPEAPSKTVENPLIDVIEKVRPANQYYLSPNAAEGILRRAESQNRKLFGPMDKALRSMAQNA